MSTARRLAWIATGYAVAVAGGVAAVAVNEAFMPADISQNSGGMVAFGDMILFVVVGGFLGLVPTWFLLRLGIERAPRFLVAALLLTALIGPTSWLAMVYLAGVSTPMSLPHAISGLIGFFIAFVAIPRIVLGPVLLLIEAATFLLLRDRVMRRLIAATMLMDFVPLILFALHLARAVRY